MTLKTVLAAFHVYGFCHCLLHIFWSKLLWLTYFGPWCHVLSPLPVTWNSPSQQSKWRQCQLCWFQTGSTENRYPMVALKGGRWPSRGHSCFFFPLSRQERTTFLFRKVIFVIFFWCVRVCLVFPCFLCTKAKRFFSRAWAINRPRNKWIPKWPWPRNRSQCWSQYDCSLASDVISLVGNVHQ